MIRSLVGSVMCLRDMSRAESWLMMYCKQTKTPYHKLTEEEKQWLMKIAQKSKIAKSHVSQRGKIGNR